MKESNERTDEKTREKNVFLVSLKRRPPQNCLYPNQLVLSLLTVTCYDEFIEFQSCLVSIHRESSLELMIFQLIPCCFHLSQFCQSSENENDKFQSFIAVHIANLVTFKYKRNMTYI